MGFNDELVTRFEAMARLLELTGANRFRVNAHAKAARVIDDLTADLSAIADDQRALTEIEGIGKGIAEKIAEYASTSKIQEHIELLGRVPGGVLDLFEVPGLGPKTIGLLWKELGVESVGDLERVLDDGSFLELPRTGQKTADKIRASLRFMRSSSGRQPLGIMAPIAESLVEWMLGAAGVTRAEHAGSLRRGRDSIGDLDILVVAQDPGAAFDRFASAPGVTEVVARGETKSSVRMSLGASGQGRWANEEGGTSDDADRGSMIQADLRVVPEASWGAALMYFTGSKAHNVRLRERALKKGLTLNEYGLFPESSETDEPPQSRGVEPVASATEGEIYAALGLPEIPPEMREDRGEIDLDEAPELITVGAIRAELHAHTTESDGSLPLRELVELAQQRGFHTITVTDHSKSSAQAGGLDEDRLRAQRADIEALREEIDGITILHGCEVDILGDGTLDYDDEFLSWLDVVVASPHVALSQEPKKATERFLRVIENPFVHVLGHPTGRLVGRRRGLEPAMDELIAAAKEHDVAMEINSHWMRLDLRDTHVRACVDAGVKVAIDCDVHRAEDFDNLRFGVATGRRGWLPAAQVINTWDAAELHAWLRSKGRDV